MQRVKQYLFAIKYNDWLRAKATQTETKRQETSGSPKKIARTKSDKLKSISCHIYLLLYYFVLIRNGNNLSLSLSFTCSRFAAVDWIMSCLSMWLKKKKREKGQPWAMNCIFFDELRNAHQSEFVHQFTLYFDSE